MFDRVLNTLLHLHVAWECCIWETSWSSSSAKRWGISRDDWTIGLSESFESSIHSILTVVELGRFYLRQILVKCTFFDFICLKIVKTMHCEKSVRIRSYSGPHFPSFGLNTERYGVSLPIHSECGKMRSRIIPNTDTFYETDYLITFLFYDVIFAHYFFFNTDGLFTTAFLNFPQPSDLLDMWSSEESLPQLSQHILSTLQKLLFTVVLKFLKILENLSTF